MRIGDIVSCIGRYMDSDPAGRHGAAFECFVICQDCVVAHHRDNYGPSVEPRPPSEKCPLCLVPWAPGTVVPTPRTPIMVFRPPSALGIAPEGVPIIGAQLGDPLRDPNRPREAGFVWDTICHACLLADERRRLGDARYRLAVMDEGDSEVCPQCHQPWDVDVSDQLP